MMSDFLALAPQAAAASRPGHQRVLADKPTNAYCRQGTREVAVHVPAQRTLFWRILSSKSMFDEKLSEWGKVAEVAVTIVGTIVADERAFYIMNFATAQRPSLTTQLEAVVRGAEQRYYHLANFPLREARQHFMSQGYVD
jgi:hypothetical protein